MVNNTDNSQSISQLIMNVDRTCYVVEDDSANCSSNSVASTGSVTPKATKPTEVGGKHASEQIEITNAEPMPIVIVPSSVATGHKSPTPSICVIEDIEEPVDKNAHASSPASQAAPTKYKGGNPRIRYGLSEEKMPQALKEEFKDFIKFYTVDINPLRNCCKYSDSTLDKVRERLMCFLGFVQRSYPTEVLSLKLAGNLPFVEGFVNYLKKNRKLMASTIGRILSAIVTGIKFTNQHVADVDTLPVVISIRNVQKQLSREEHMVKRRKRKGFSSEKGGQFLFAHILDAMRQLKEQYYNTSGIGSSRSLHDFTMLSLYIRALSGRCKELRTLRLHDNSQSEHPFLATGSLSNYLGNMFEREVDIRASTNKMRHAIVTHFMNMPESQNIKLRESVASLLKHSVRHQQQTYNDQHRHEKTVMGRSFMHKTISDLDPFEGEENEMANARAYARQDEEKDEELLPQIGEICALLDPASTSDDDAYIFVAKVLRYTPDKKRVCLQEMQEVPDSEHLYRVKTSSMWWENVQCLTYAVDVVYNNSEKAYELRTNPAEIYNYKFA